MKLYWCANFKNRYESRLLLQLALEDYTKKKVEIFEEKNGKPYINRKDVYFNVSHSQNLWVCGISNNFVGVDVEIVHNRKYQKVVDKFFKPEESIYVKEHGLSGFFEIWTLKEAHSKLLGESIFKNLNFSAIDHGELRKWYSPIKNIKNNESSIKNSNNRQICIRYESYNKLNEIEKLMGFDEIKCTLAKAVEKSSDEINVKLKEINL